MMRQDEANGVRHTYDDANPRCQMTEYECIGKCGVWMDEDEVIWATPDGRLNTDTGSPFCEACLPADPDDMDDEG
jgi:hypothetical protein